MEQKGVSGQPARTCREIRLRTADIAVGVPSGFACGVGLRARIEDTILLLELLCESVGKRRQGRPK